MIPRYDDPRVLEAGNEAFGVLVRALGWAETNGAEYVSAAAAAMLGRRSSWARLAAAGLVRIEGSGASARAFLGPFPAPSSAVGESPQVAVDRSPRRPQSSPQVADGIEAKREAWARRKRDERARSRGHVTRDTETLGRDMSRPDGVTVTRDMSHARVSLSDLDHEIIEKKESESAGARDVTPHVTLETLPAPTGDIPPFVAVVIAQFSHGRGVTLDPFLEWQGFLANAHKRAEGGQVASASEHDFRMWVARSVKHAEASRATGRVLQRDPPGRTAYEVAQPDDPL